MTIDRVLAVGMIGLNVSGSGWAAEAHAPAVQAVPGLELAAVATRRQDSADAAAERFGIGAAYGDPSELIHAPGIDVVAVVSPVPTHRTLILEALAAGKHVLTEWPVAVGPGQMSEIAAAFERRSEVRSAVNLQARRAPAVVTAGRLIADGRIGRVLNARVYSTTAGFGGTIPAGAQALESPETWMNLGTIQTAHTLDAVTAVLGPIEQAHALLDVQYPQIEVQGGSRIDRVLADHILMTGRLQRGGTVSLEVQGGRPAGETPFTLHVIGTDGVLEVRGGGARGFQASPLTLQVDGRDFPLPPTGFDALAPSVQNVAHTYAAFRDDIRGGDGSAPTFHQAAELAGVLTGLGIGVGRA